VALAGAAIALVGLAEALSAARLFAVKHGYRLDTDQELVANGAANIGSSIVGGLGVAGSLSKTAAVDRAGGTSQVSALGGAALAIAAILLAAPALSVLPKAVLSAIVVHAVWGLMDVRAIRRYMRIRLKRRHRGHRRRPRCAYCWPASRPRDRGGPVTARIGVPVEPG
jgi:MFS superfamily sulfate permease-like transporter